jgi:hypothetical protein
LHNDDDDEKLKELELQHDFKSFLENSLCSICYDNMNSKTGYEMCVHELEIISLLSEKNKKIHFSTYNTFV